MVAGRRVVCTFNRGHRGDCKPVRELHRLAEVEERAADGRRRFLWLEAHRCDDCDRYLAAVHAGSDRQDALPLRCPAARNVQLLLDAAEVEDVDTGAEPLEDE